MSDSPTKRAVLELKRKEGNDVCADCGKAGKLAGEATNQGLRAWMFSVAN